MIKIEKTDTFGGEANYSWVERYELDAFTVNDSDLKIMRRIKKVIGWTGVKCIVMKHGDFWEIRPRNFCNVVFVYFN